MNQNIQDKEIVNDCLSMYNSSLTKYAGYIAETSNQQLRQTLQQIRNADEQFQFQLSQLAEQKGFYQPASQVSQQELQKTKQQLS